MCKHCESLLYFFLILSPHCESAGIGLKFGVSIPTFRRKQWKICMSPNSRIELFAFLWGYKWKICVVWIVPWASELWKNMSQQGEELYTALNAEYCTTIGNKIPFLSLHTLAFLYMLCAIIVVHSPHICLLLLLDTFVYYCGFSYSWQYGQIGLMSLPLTAV